jgi:hypothetical protein
MRHPIAFGAACAAALIAANLAFAEGAMSNTNSMGTTNGSAMTGQMSGGTTTNTANTTKPKHHKKPGTNAMNGGMSGGSMSGGAMSGGAMSGDQSGGTSNNAMGSGH